MQFSSVQFNLTSVRLVWLLVVLPKQDTNWEGDYDILYCKFTFILFSFILLELLPLLEAKASPNKQGYHGYGDTHGGDPNMGMGMGTVINYHGRTGILWVFF